MAAEPFSLAWAESLLAREDNAKEAAQDVLAALELNTGDSAQHCLLLSVFFRSPAVSRPLLSLASINCLLDRADDLLSRGEGQADGCLKALNNLVMGNIAQAQELLVLSEDKGEGMMRRLLALCSKTADSPSSALIACRFLFRLVANTPQLLELLRKNDEILSMFQTQLAFHLAKKALEEKDDGEEGPGVVSPPLAAAEACVFVAKLLCALFAGPLDDFPASFAVPSSSSSTYWCGEKSFGRVIALWLDYCSRCKNRPTTSTDPAITTTTAMTPGDELLLQVVNCLFMLSSASSSFAIECVERSLLAATTAGRDAVHLDAATVDARLDLLAGHLVVLALKHDRGSGGDDEDDKDNSTITIALVAALSVAKTIIEAEALRAAKPKLLALLTAAPVPLHLLQTLNERVLVPAYELYWALCDEDPKVLVEALTFPLAAGILQSKGAIDVSGAASGASAGAGAGSGGGSAGEALD